jgi:hypothetical protein
MKSSILWDITPVSPLKVNRHFGGTCRLHLQVRRISQAKNQRGGGFLLGLFFDPEDEGDMFLRDVGLTFNGLHCVISQKTELYVPFRLWDGFFDFIYFKIQNNLLDRDCVLSYLSFFVNLAFQQFTSLMPNLIFNNSSIIVYRSALFSSKQRKINIFTQLGDKDRLWNTSPHTSTSINIYGPQSRTVVPNYRHPWGSKLPSRRCAVPRSMSSLNVVTHYFM